MQGNSFLKGIILKALGDEELMPEEKSMLDAWLTDEDNKRDFEKLKDKDFLHQMITEYHDYDIEEGKSITQQKLQNRAKVIHIRNWMRYAAAVIVLMIGSVTFYFLILKKHENRIINQPTLAKANNDVAPGRYRAKLTLADGSFIVLDSVMIGKLAQQGGTQVMNKDGKLVYAKQGVNGNEVLYNTLTTSRGQMYPIVLSDNSHIWLNSESSIKYPVAFVGNERRVEITGEAYFEIEHDASKPFIVVVNGTEIKVLGTKFNVNAYKDEGAIRTTLLEGAVQVKKRNQFIIIKPGEQAQVSGNTINIINDVDVDDVIAWKNGLFAFNNDDTKTIMRQIGRWYDVDVTYRGVIPNRRFGGKISRGDNLSQVLQTLESNDVHFKLEGKTIIVTP
jgi:ferric-dicitrate binding protein FerR (iron transport regulator)